MSHAATSAPQGRWQHGPPTASRPRVRGTAIGIRSSDALAPWAMAPGDDRGHHPTVGDPWARIAGAGGCGPAEELLGDEDSVSAPSSCSGSVITASSDDQGIGMQREGLSAAHVALVREGRARDVMAEFADTNRAPPLSTDFAVVPAHSAAQLDARALYTGSTPLYRTRTFNMAALSKVVARTLDAAVANSRFGWFHDSRCGWRMRFFVAVPRESGRGSVHWLEAWLWAPKERTPRGQFFSVTLQRWRGSPPPGATPTLGKHLDGEASGVLRGLRDAPSNSVPNPNSRRHILRRIESRAPQYWQDVQHELDVEGASWENFLPRLAHSSVETTWLINGRTGQVNNSIILCPRRDLRHGGFALRRNDNGHWRIATYLDPRMVAFNAFLANQRSSPIFERYFFQYS